MILTNMAVQISDAHRALNEVVEGEGRSLVERVSALVVAYKAEKERAASLVTCGRPDTAPESWEAIVTAALRWRRGADRGELAAAVDAFRGSPSADSLNVASNLRRPRSDDARWRSGSEAGDGEQDPDRAPDEGTMRFGMDAPLPWWA